jgi:hypothetical protein
MLMMAVGGSYHDQQWRISGGELGAVDARVDWEGEVTNRSVDQPVITRQRVAPESRVSERQRRSADLAMSSLHVGLWCQIPC